MCKISEPYDNPFWEKSNRIREKEEEEKQAGAELCQAQVKLGSQASSLSLPFKISLTLKIGTL